MATLPEPVRRRVERLYDVTPVTGMIVPPVELEPWLLETFGSGQSVRRQTVLRVRNRVTHEETILAPLRARRPMDGAAVADLRAEIDRTRGDPFCHPETGTPEEPIGRVRGERVVTGANAALAEEHHAVLVFDEHDPLAFDAALVTDVLLTGRAWAERWREVDPEATNYLLVWNCLWRAGGSIVHGHAQALLGAGRHYAGQEGLRRAAVEHARAEPGADLVEDMLAAHRALGLTIELAGGVTLASSLTPLRERELLVVGTAGMEETDPAFADAVARTLLAYRDRIGVRSFNLALWRPPLGGPPHDGWERIAPIVRLVDRGDLARRPSDVGAMELFASPIVGSDPFELIEMLR